MKANTSVVTLLRSYEHGSDPEIAKVLNQLESCFGKFKQFNDLVMDHEQEMYVPGEDQDEEGFLGSCLKQLAGLVDCLFEVLPSIDRLRQIWILKLEKQSQDVAVSLETITAVSERTSHSAKTPQVSHGNSVSSSLINHPSSSPSLKTARQDIDPSGISLLETELELRAQDELNFTGGSDEMAFSGKGKTIVPADQDPAKESRHSPNQDKPSAATNLNRYLKKRGPKSQSQASLEEVIAMNLELATAMHLSLIDAQAEAAKEQHEDKEAMVQVKEWDQEIKRLRDWSHAFNKSLGFAPSEEETTRLYTIFEQLAKIGGAFGTLLCLFSGFYAY